MRGVRTSALLVPLLWCANGAPVARGQEAFEARPPSPEPSGEHRLAGDVASLGLSFEAWAKEGAVGVALTFADKSVEVRWTSAGSFTVRASLRDDPHRGCTVL